VLSACGAAVHATCLLIVERVLKMSGAQNKVLAAWISSKQFPVDPIYPLIPCFMEGEKLVLSAPGTLFKPKSTLSLYTQHQFLVTMATVVLPASRQIAKGWIGNYD
jgi:hypothetical protein